MAALQETAARLTRYTRSSEAEARRPVLCRLRMTSGCLEALREANQKPTEKLDRLSESSYVDCPPQKWMPRRPMRNPPWIVVALTTLPSLRVCEGVDAALPKFVCWQNALETKVLQDALALRPCSLKRLEA